MDTQITVENQGLMYNLRHRFTRLEGYCQE